MIRTLIAFFVFFCSNICLNAQEIDKIPAITVTGKAEIQIAPDEVVFSLNVTKTDKDLQAAKRLSDESVGKIFELSRRFSVLPQNVKTTYISVDMKYESIRNAKTEIYDEDGDEIGKKVFKGYEVSKTMTIRLTDISRFEEFLGEVLKTGLSEINNVKFETSKLTENRVRAREMAMKAAKEKATVMAAALGQTIGKAIKIAEGNISGPAYPNYATTSNSVAPSREFSESLATFAAGTIAVESVVTVSFQLN